MRELPKAASDLLRQVRSAHDPSLADVERSLCRLQASLSFGVDVVHAAAHVAQPTVATSSHVGGAVLTAKAIKLGVVVAAMGASITAAMLQRELPASPSGRSAVSSRQVEARVTRPSAESPAAAALAEPSATANGARAVLPVHRMSPRPHAATKANARHEAPTLAARAAPHGQANAVAPPVQAGPSELDLIASAATNLRDGQLSRALSLLDEHRALYPTGLLQTEQQGLRVLALCGLGQVEQASQERRMFLRHAGRTPLAARVRRACVDPQEP